MRRLQKFFFSAAVALFCVAVLVPAVMAAAKPDGSIGGLSAKFIDVNGVKTRYYDYGQGEPMVLIHGGSTAGSSTANVWSRNIPGLAKRFHVFAVDRLASGLTADPPSDDDYTPQGDVDHVYRFIQTLKLGRVHLVGHSAGGGIAFYLAIEHPEVVRTLTIVAHGPESPAASDGPTKLQPELKKCPDQSQYEGLRCRVEKLAWLPTTFEDEYWEADRYMATLPKSREARDKINAGAGEAFRKNFPAWREKMWERVRNDGALQVPVLMYAGKDDVLDWGVNDPVAKLTGELGLFDIIAAKNDRLQMIVIPNGGHFMYREHPEVFNHDLIGFIDFWERQGGSKSAAGGK